MTNFRIVLSLLSSIVFVITVGAQSQVELQEVLDLYFSENNVPGITAAVQFQDGEVWRGSSGFSHGTVEMDTSLYVGVASNTKLFTSILSLMMIENGSYSLEDPISKWLEPIQFVDPSITVKQLLHHNGGVNDFIGNNELFPNLIISDPTRIWTPEETLAYIFEPLGAPGEGVFYSNANYLLAAMVMEAATGRKYEDLLRDSILLPLELNDIFMEGFEEIPGEMAHPFLLGNDFSDTERTALGTITWAAGFLVTKPASLARWYDIVFNTTYFSDFVHTNIKDFIAWPDDPEGKDMGMGLYRIDINDRLYHGHGGGTVGYASYTLYDTECGHTVCVAINELFTRPLDLAISLSEKACELTSSSKEEVIKANVSVLPNPASNFLRVENASSIQLLNLSGRLVNEVVDEEMNVHDVSAGVYLVRAVVAGEMRTGKVVIVH